MTRKPQPKLQPPNVATMTQRLRAQTIKLLGLDPAKLDPADEVLIARAGTLRLLVSDIEAEQMRGGVINAASYISASQELERMVRDAHRVAVSEGGAPQGLVDARAKVARLLGIAMSEDDDAGYGQAHRIAELEAEVASLRAEFAERSAPSVALAPPPRSETPPPVGNVVPLRSDPPSLPISPVVASDARGWLDGLNRRSY